MKRLLMAVAGGWLVLLAAGPAWADDEITYIDRTSGKEAVLKGAIQSEGPGGIVVAPSVGAGTQKVPAEDVVDVKYDVPASIRLKLNSAVTSIKAAEGPGTAAARKTAAGEATEKLQALQADVTDDKAKRWIDFELGRLTALQAQDDPSKANLDKAIAQLKAFKTSAPKSWEIIKCANLLAQLQEQNDDAAGALTTYEEMAKAADVPKELALAYDVKAAQVLVTLKRFPEAKKRLETIKASLPPESPEAVRVQVAFAACVAEEGQIDQAAKSLEAILNQTKDPELKAMAYNTLGDCYQKANKLEEARWQYEWVDVVYHRNKEQQAKAIYNLAKVFHALKEEDKAEQYRARLKEPAFAGSEYARMLASEK